MVNNEKKRAALENMIELLELPISAYEKAKNRYDDLGQWFARDGSLLRDKDPHVFPQGSFLLGTAIRPINDGETYDLDLACKLRVDFSKTTGTQEQLKELIGSEIESYRVARQIQSQKERKHRCWRLEYRDDLSFHMDIVPCIPAEETKRTLVFEAMQKSGESQDIALSSSQTTLCITDDRHPRYRQICDDWNISNPEGYAKWFVYRMLKSGGSVLMAKAQIDDVPIYERKTALQRAVQLLKRHRDQMFKEDPDLKPVSVIITTLASRAYQGEIEIEAALDNILTRMGSFVNSTRPKVPNPVDPEEDFADHWSIPKYSHLHLEENFWNWLKQAKSDFELIGSSENVAFLAEQANRKFSINLDAEKLRARLGFAAPSIIVASPKSHNVDSASAKPWSWG